MAQAPTKRRQIEDDLRALIAASCPGDEVPGEHALASTYGVARETVRRALQALEHEGLLDPGRPGPRTVAKRELRPVHLSRSPGRTHPGEAPTPGADAWMADQLAAGREPEQHITVVNETASAEVAARLALDPGDRVVSRRIIRYAAGKPDSLITFWFTDAVARGTILAGQESITEGSIAWLERNKGPIEHLPWEMTPRPPAPHEAEALRIPPGVAVAEVWRAARNPDGMVMASWAIYAGDRAKLVGP